MPLISGRVVIDTNWGAETGTPVGAARNHHIGAIAIAGRTHAAQHVNVVVCRAPGVVHSQEYLPYEASRIDRPTNHAASHVHRRDLIKGGRLIPILGVARANAPEAASTVSTPNEEIAVASNVKCPPMGGVRQTERSLPGRPAIGGAVEQPASAGRSRAPSLVLKAVPWTICLINGKPFLVASSCVTVRLQFQPRLAAICGAVNVITKCLQQAKIKKRSCLISIQHRVAAEDARLEVAGERPRDAVISGITPATLAEVRSPTIELSPADGHFAGVGWIDCDRWLIRRVADNIVVIGINVDLVADEAAVWRDHSRRGLQSVNGCRRHVVFF